MLKERQNKRKKTAVQGSKFNSKILAVAATLGLMLQVLASGLSHETIA